MESFLDNLKELSTALDDYANEHPHVIPYAMLEEAKGESAILHEDAEKLWDEIAQRLPDDGLTQHHLAVIRHASAFRSLHRDQHDAEAREQWLAGLRHWKKVIDCDDFWNHLTEVWTARRDSEKGEKLAERLLSVDLQAFRRALPTQLLKVHVEIIQASISGNPDAARIHIGLIRKSGFPEAATSEAVNLVYKMVVGSRKDGDPDQAIQAIEDYLKIDSGSRRALQDRLDVAIRICKDKARSIQSRISAMKAAQSKAELLKSNSKPTDSDRDRVFETLREFYLTWAKECDDEAWNAYKNDRSSNELFRDALERAGQACEFEKTGVRAQTLYREVTWSVAITCYQNISPAAAAVKAAQAKFPKHAAGHVALARVQLCQGNDSAARTSLSAAETKNQAQFDSDVNSKISALRDLMGHASEFGSFVTIEYVLASQGCTERSDWRGSLRNLEAAKRAQPRDMKSTIEILGRMHNCYKMLGDYTAMSRTKQEVDRVAALFNLRVQLP